MKIAKRILSALLCAVLLLTAAPVTKFKAEAAETKHSVGDIIEFGTYPQSKVTNSATVSSLNSASKTWISYGYMSGAGTSWSDGSAQPADYMKYCDVTYNGAKYRGVMFSTYRPYYTNYKSTTSTSYTYQYDNGYYINTTYWFKYEPLKWRVLDPKEGLVVCENIIDSQAYSNTLNSAYRNSSGAYASDYVTSSIREWLNDDFYNTAFDSSQKGQISGRKLDNSSPWNGNAYGSASTTDKVFLLSYNEVTNSNYGFSSSSSDYDINRRAHSTDYAKCQGTYVYTGSDYQTADGEDTSWWWLRSPGIDSDSACSVGYYGYADDYIRHVDTTHGGVRPALKISTIENFNVQIKLNRKSLTVSNNVCPTLFVTEYPNGVSAEDLVWTSSNKEVATISAGNVIEPNHYGKTEIKVATVDGKYSATCELTVEASFVITSDSSSVKSIRCGDTATYRIYFYNYNAEELSVKDAEFSITDSGVLKVINRKVFDKYIELELKAVSEGAEVIEAYSDEPLAYNKFKISVYPENVDWRADKVPNFDKKEKENFRRSTFVVENYSYVYNESDETYTVSMDVYNMAGDFPVLAAYNSFGEMVDFDAADRFVGMPGDWVDFLGTLGFGAVQMINGDMFTYRGNTMSKKSTVSVKVPADGYITISNDITLCPAAAIFNISSLLIEMVMVTCNLSSDEADKDKDVTKEFVKSLKKKVPDFDEFLYKIIEKFVEKSSKKMTTEYLTSILLFSRDSIYELCEEAGSSFEKIAGDAFLSVLGKNIQGYISKSAMETLIKKEITDAVTLSKLKTAEKFFTAGKILGLADFALNTLMFNNGSGITTIQFNPCGENGFVCKDKIKVISDIIDSNTVLHHYIVKTPGLPLKEELKIDINDIVEVHEIALIKNGKKVEDTVFRATVEMEIPKNVLPFSVKVFRVEKDGTYTQLETSVINGKVTFITDHFSEYILTGKVDYKVPTVSIGDISMNYKDSTTLKPTIDADPSVNYTVSYKSSDPKIAKVDENGKVTAAKKGSATITCTVTDELGNTVTDTCKVNVGYSFGQWLIIILLFGWIWYI